MTKKTKSTKQIAVIGDTQVKPGAPVNHIEAYANYIAEHRPTDVLMVGDWFDFTSLNSYDKAGQDGWELRDLKEDLDCGNEAMSTFMRILRKQRSYKPNLIFTKGNHEFRLERARKDPFNRRFKSFLDDDQMNLKDWRVVPYLKVVKLHGVACSHYFTQGVMDRPIGGSIQNMIKHVGSSFIMGHQQSYQLGQQYTASGKRMRGAIVGSFYQHNEDYLSYQGNNRCWRGTIYCHEVKNGDFNALELSIDYLLREWL